MPDSPGYRRLKAHPDYEAMIARTLAEQRRALEEVVRIKSTADRSPKKDDYPITKRRKRK